MRVEREGQIFQIASMAEDGRKRAFPYFSEVESIQLKRGRLAQGVHPGRQSADPKVFEQPSLHQHDQARVASTMHVLCLPVCMQGDGCTMQLACMCLMHLLSPPPLNSAAFYRHQLPHMDGCTDQGLP